MGALESRVIRKYDNRKLYDLSTSKYVSTLQILDMVHAGQKVQVLTHGELKDVTRPVLLSALFEKGKQEGMDDQTITEFLQKVAEHFSGGQNV